MKTLKEFNDDCDKKDREFDRCESFAFAILLIGFIICAMGLLNGCAITDDLDRAISPQGMTWHEMNPDYGVDK